MPFLVSGLLFVVAAGAMWSVELGGRTGAEDEDEDEDELRLDDGVDRSGFGDGDGESDAEKQTFLHPPSPQRGSARHVPAPLRLGLQEGGFLEVGLETPLFSPGLRIMETGGGL